MKKFEKLEDEKLSVAQPILDACKAGLLERFKNYFNFNTVEFRDALIASVTLPNFKLGWIYTFKNFYSHIADINQEVNKIILQAARELAVEDKAATDTEEIFFEEDDFFELEKQNDNVSLRAVNNFKQKVELEFLQYINNTDTSLISLNNYPTMKELFYKYNTCLASSAPVERLFSFAEIINNPRRHALTDNNFQKLVLLKSNSIK